MSFGAAGRPTCFGRPECQARLSVTMPNRLARETSPYLRQHADNPVDWHPWGPGCAGQGPHRAEAHLSQHRLFDLPLVPRDGARVVRESRIAEPAERAFRPDQGGPGGAARRGPGLHGLRPGPDRPRGLAAQRLADAGAQAVLRRHVLSAGGPRRAGPDSRRSCGR